MANRRLPMRVRFDILQDAEGWTVVDIFTGLPVDVDGVPQIGMSIFDADDLADLLNYRESLKAVRED